MRQSLYCRTWIDRLCFDSFNQILMAAALPDLSAYSRHVPTVKAKTASNGMLTCWPLTQGVNDQWGAIPRSQLFPGRAPGSHTTPRRKLSHSGPAGSSDTNEAEGLCYGTWAPLARTPANVLLEPLDRSSWFRHAVGEHAVRWPLSVSGQF